jgi:PIN domain nuclease of toxin-antitoxin system
MTDTRPLAVQFSQAARVARLPFHHYDPFDRLLIAQAQAEQLLIVTSDPQFKPYDIEIIAA